MSFQISDASEIQFWPTGTESFNIKQEAYTESRCYNQKFLCSALRRLQVLGVDTYDKNLRLSILEDGNEAETLDYTKASTVTKAEADPDNLAANYGSGVSWTITTYGHVDLAQTQTSKLLRAGILNGEANKSLKLILEIDASATGVGTTYLGGTFYLYNEDMTESAIQTFGGYELSSILTANPTIDVDITPDFVPVWIGVSLENPASTGPTIHADVTFEIDPDSFYNSLDVYSVSFSPYDYTLCDKFLSFKVIQKADDPEDEVELFYTDEVEFVSVWANSNSEGRVNIQFRSIQNFAGLIYDDESPYFTIDLDGQFCEPDFQTTEKVLELTEMVLNTASTLKEKSMLIIMDLPRYMHRKVLLILQHAISGSVIIEGIEISLDGGSYELTKRDTLYNLKPAQILLTHKNSFTHNVI